MEEQGTDGNGKVSKPELESEASRLRREKLFPHGTGSLDSGIVTPVKGGRLRRIIYTLLTLACIAGAVLLLALPGLRTGLAEKMAGTFDPDQDNRLYILPAPPPKAPNVTEQYQASSDALEDDEILYSGQQQPEKIEPFSEIKEPVSLPRTPGSLDAFAFMQEDKGLVGALLKGERAEMEFKTWNLVSQTPPIYYLDIVTSPPGQETELHLIFSVDLSKKEIVPLSQAARDFMAQ